MVDPTTGSSEITQDEKTMAMITCLLGIFTSFVGPLIMYFIKKDQSKFVAYYAMQMMMFQGGIFILHIVAGALIVFTFGLLTAALWILSIVFGIISAMAANKGEWYELPVAGKFAKQQVGIA